MTYCRSQDCFRRIVLVAACTMLISTAAHAQNPKQDTRPGPAPDIREHEVPLKFQDGDFVVVPIPISNPTLDTGLVVGAAYFYPQSEEKKGLQPASVTALGGMYTSNDSKAIVLGQTSYWNNDNWRFTGAIGAADVNVTLIAPDEATGTSRVDWGISGLFLNLRLSRQFLNNWYGGLFARYIDANQDLSIADVDDSFDVGDVRSSGAGLFVEYDSRDMPINSYTGRYFEVQALFNVQLIGSERTYQAYAGKFRSYHSLSDKLVFAWELQGCSKHGTIPLWDACRIPLRGFSAFDYLGKTSMAGQGSLRWHFSKRWGVVGFAGVGTVGSTFANLSEDAVDSYGAGIRFMVLPAKRINLRVDFARSEGSSAVHVSVGEAF